MGVVGGLVCGGGTPLVLGEMPRGYVSTCVG